MEKESITTKVTFNAEISLLHSMLDWIRDQLKFVKIAPAEQKKIEIALEEALVNIISYAYKKPGGPIDLIFYYLPEEALTFTLKDKGTPFNPIKNESEILEYLPLEERPEGGLGIPMIRKLVDDVSYERQEDTNVLKLMKRCA